MARKNSLTHQGFSLVELSIVLVILGLLVGGVLGGQSLIKAAQLRAVTTEYDAWQTAVNAFRLRFNSLPGDTNIAQRVWGNTVTTNGNNDGRLDWGASEQYRFWQHLSLAGLINGQFTGVQGAHQWDHIIGVNAPASRYSGGGWSVAYVDNSPGNYDVTHMFRINNGNFFSVGTTTGNMTYSRLLTPEEAWNIDTKLDDGKPAKGKVIGHAINTSCTDAVDNLDLDAEYRLNQNTPECALFFIKAF